MTNGFLFPGQGSQSVGMLADLAADFRQVEDTFAEASEVLGFDLWALTQAGPVDQLNQTELTQPVLLAADIATWRVWQELDGPRPDMLAGHSLGEYAALVAAEALGFAAAVILVNLRGQYMQQATPAGKGAMAAILGLDDSVVEQLCQEASGEQIAAPANYNSPGQIVIAGDSEAVERAIELAKAAGSRRAVILPVSVPSHCQLMTPAAEHLASALEDVEISRPVIPVLHNVDCRTRNESEAIGSALVAQLCSPVRWTDTIQSMVDQGVNRLAECGPGKVLSGLSRRIDRQTPCSPLQDPAAIKQTIEVWSGS